MKFNAFGKQVSIKVADKPKTQDIVRTAQEALRKYIDLCAPFHNRMIENEEWYKSRHWEYIRNKKYKDDPEPTTAFVLATVQNKHADAMDFYPKPNTKPRSAKDVKESKRLSEILPVELEYNDFYDTWWHVWHNKLTIGCGIYSVLFDPDGNDGVGSGAIKSIDPISFLCNPHVDNLNDSPFIFVPELITKDNFKAQYPEVDESRVGKLFEPKQYTINANNDTSDMILVIDAYYLEQDPVTRARVCHFFKFAGDELLYHSKDDPANADGYYKCGEFPFKIDQLYFEKGNIFGFGMIDAIKSPQIYIDKLDQIILANTFGHSRKRHLARKDVGINMEQYLDPSKPVVEFVGQLDENSFREIKTEPTDAAVFNHRIQKIQELKDVSSANEFSRGETGGGVTAAQAIVALQKASGKTSRADIQKSYNVFSQVIYLYIEHIRQFYDIPRDYRINDKAMADGYRFESFDNTNIKPQESTGLMIQGQEPQYRKPVFDIKVEPEKRDPFSEAAHNELSKELYGMGVFDPERIIPGTVLLSMMEFEGKERIEEMIKENAKINEQLLMGQQAMMENQKLKLIVQKLTGQDLGAQMPQEGVQQ